MAVVLLMVVVGVLLRTTGQAPQPAYVLVPGQVAGHRLDLDAYCGGDGAWLPGQEASGDVTGRQVYATNAAFTWSCGQDGPKLSRRDFDAVCQQQNPGSAAWVADPDDAYSWACR
ncbi:hypothetical protein [Streptomyces sp. So13.3]|uniref:hypothetical protein n=1 Tax=Streptomyces sp. So13.3 TaxID=2136173 RepID=UPI001FD29BF5|nr:hypothetical protein [Streptomyces sp. So13.3]